jgi:hypothetical protein
LASGKYRGTTRKDVDRCIAALKQLPDEFFTSDLIEIARREGWEDRGHVCLTSCVDAQILARKVDGNRILYRKRALLDAPNARDLVVEYLKARKALLDGGGK